MELFNIKYYLDDTSTVGEFTDNVVAENVEGALTKSLQSLYDTPVYEHLVEYETYCDGEFCDAGDLS